MNDTPAPARNTMRAPGNTFASVAVRTLVAQGHDPAAVRAAVVALKGDSSPDPLLTPDEVDAVRAAVGADPLTEYMPPDYRPAWQPTKDYGRWNEHWGTSLPPVDPAPDDEGGAS